MIETPQNTGKQNTIAFSLNEKINKDTMVSLMKDDEAIITFTAQTESSVDNCIFI